MAEPVSTENVEFTNDGDWIIPLTGSLKLNLINMLVAQKTVSFRVGLKLCQKNRWLGIRKRRKSTLPAYHTPKNRPTGVHMPNSKTLTEALHTYAAIKANVQLYCTTVRWLYGSVIYRYANLYLKWTQVRTCFIPSSPSPLSPNALTSRLCESGDWKWWLCRFLLVLRCVSRITEPHFIGDLHTSHISQLLQRPTTTDY